MSPQDRSTDSRLGSLEARADTNDERWDDIKQYMIRNGVTMNEINKSLALIVNNQEDFKKYKEQCDSDRTSLNKRITATENTAKLQIGMATAAGGLVSFLAWGGSKVVEKVAGWFS